jgi:GNAT superfamily N-acetyltransferase
VLRFELLGAGHDRRAFDCGVEPLNSYLRQVARQHIEKGVSQTFVLVDESRQAPKPVVGFITVSLCQVLAHDLPVRWAKRLPERIPAMRLGRLAVSRARQGEGLGKVLIFEAMRLTVSVADVAGGVGLFVDAKNQAGARFYDKFGFEPIPGSPLTLFLPMETLRRALGP